MRAPSPARERGRLEAKRREGRRPALDAAPPLCDTRSTGRPHAAADGGPMLPGNLEEILKSIGLLGIWAMIFAESGLLVGFFLPGDSVLFTAGVLAADGH